MRTREELIEECKRIAGGVANATERAFTPSRPAGWTCASCRRFVSSSEAIGDCLARCPQCSLANAVTKDGYVMGRVWPERVWPAPELPDSTVQKLVGAGVYPVVEGEVRLTPYEECRKIVRQWHGLADGSSRKLAAVEQFNADFEAGRVKIPENRFSFVAELAQQGVVDRDEARALLEIPQAHSQWSRDHLGVWRECAPDPLDVRYDDVTLRDLLAMDAARRQESGAVRCDLCSLTLDEHRLKRGRDCGAFELERFTPTQRAAVSAHWSAELRSRVDAAKAKERHRVVLDLDPEDL